MQAPRSATRVRFYLGEDDRWHGRSLAQALIGRLRKAGAAGGTVFRGVAGFGVHLQMHSAVSESTSLKLPIIVEWIDTPERVERLLPELSAMVTEGLITVEPITVIKYAHRGLRPIAEDRTVSDVMTRDFVAVQRDTPLRTLVELLIRRNYRALPVTDREGRIAGIVTNGDLIDRGGLGLRAELLHTLATGTLAQELERLERDGKTAADIMTSEVVTVRPETDLRSAGQLMSAQRLKRLPVVEQDGHVVGIVSRVDILRAAGENFPVEEPPESTVAHGGASSVPAIVGAAMNRQVPMVPADASLPEVLDAVVSTRLNRAVVVDHERRPLGVISDEELLRRIDPVHHPNLIQVLMRRLPFVYLSPEERERLRAETGTRAGDLMVAPAVTVSESTFVIDAIRRMLAHKHKILPVVDAEGRLVGMIDRADLLRAIVTE